MEPTSELIVASPERDAKFLRLALSIAQRSAARGNHPFGCVIVVTARATLPASWITWAPQLSEAMVDAGSTFVLAEGFNTVLTEHDPTGHAETNAVRIAAKRAHQWELEVNAMGALATAHLPATKTIRFGDFFHVTLFTSTEPCAMCSGCIYWSFLVHRVVYACPESGLAKYAGDDFLQPCRSIFAKGKNQAIEIVGPVLSAEETESVHAAYEGWKALLAV